MGKLTHLMIHCADTPEGMWFSGADIKGWHVDPPPAGRGWRKPGYSDVILLDGKVENLIDYDADDWVESWEISNGAAGWNGKTRHICYIGGRAKATDGGESKDTRTTSQLIALETYVKLTLRLQKDLKVIGHNQVHATKYCPSFDVPAWAKDIGVKDKNIDFTNYANNPYLT